ncbi:MAG TPA: hypothetical protein VEL74_00295 [Thermoanaerobaculia bacterium]|nr:hypothetical protein [Thermoanaerobaculia bacterium]
MRWRWLLAALALAACEPREVPGAAGEMPAESPEAVRQARERREIRQKSGCVAPWPSGAREAVESVQKAAAAGNAAALRPFMASELTWSFGGDADAGQAIKHWRQNPEVLREMAAILARGCVVQETPEGASERIVCPPEYESQSGYLGYRAGFERRGEVWKMTFFVQGD